MAENGMIVTYYTHGNAEIVVYRPAPDAITDKERKKREDEIVRALTEFGKERARRRMAEKEVTAQRASSPAKSGRPMRKQSVRNTHSGISNTTPLRTAT